MSSEKSTKGHSIGYLIDHFWEVVPKDDPANKWELITKDTPSADGVLLKRGKHVISFCKSQSCTPSLPLKKEDQNAWLRLVGAWVTFRKFHHLTRNTAGQRTDMDASNITNLINGKRPLTQNAAAKMGDLLGVKEIDLRPDAGSNHARKTESRANEVLSQLRSHALIVEMAVHEHMKDVPDRAAVFSAIDRLKSASV